MKTLKSLAGGMVLLAAIGTANAESLLEKDMIPGEFSGSVTLTNDYVFRGISQTDDVPAVQGSIDWAHDVGVHAGIWASNVKFTDASIEIDYTLGFGRSVDKFSYDVTAIYYSYPGAASTLNYDFWEIAPSIGYDFDIFSVGAGANYSPNYFGDSGDAIYGYLNVSVPVGKYFTVGANVGHQSIDKNANFGTRDYVDWGINISTEIAGFDFSVGYTDTDLADAQCGGGDACGIFLFTVSKSF